MSRTRAPSGYVTLRCEYYPSRRKVVFTSFQFHAPTRAVKAALRADLAKWLGLRLRHLRPS